MSSLRSSVGSGYNNSWGNYLATGEIDEIESKLEVIKELFEDIRDLLKKISEELST